MAGILGYSLAKGSFSRRVGIALVWAVGLHIIYNAISLMRPVQFMGWTVANPDPLQLFILALSGAALWLESRNIKNTKVTAPPRAAH